MANPKKIVANLEEIKKKCNIKKHSTILPNKFPLENYKSRGYQLEPVDYQNGERIRFT